jgi:hypothetical protein
MMTAMLQKRLSFAPNPQLVSTPQSQLQVYSTGH